jgi:hypothetical protein
MGQGVFRCAFGRIESAIILSDRMGCQHGTRSAFVKTRANGKGNVDERRPLIDRHSFIMAFRFAYQQSTFWYINPALKMLSYVERSCGLSAGFWMASPS